MPLHELVGIETGKQQAALAARGFGAGDVLALQAPNSDEWIATAFAALRLGGAVTGVSGLATPPEVERQLIDSGAALHRRGRSAQPRAAPREGAGRRRATALLERDEWAAQGRDRSATPTSSPPCARSRPASG